MSDNSHSESSSSDYGERLAIASTQIAAERHQQSNDIFADLLAQAKRDVYESIIAELANRKWGTIKTDKVLKIDKGTKVIKDKKGNERLVRVIQNIPTSEKEEGWVPIIPEGQESNNNGIGKKKWLRLEYAMEIANYVADQVGSLFRTTYYDPNVRTVNIAAQIAMQACHKLDNPDYEFDGNETDSAAFAMKVVSHVDAALKNSVGGFIPKLIGESTTNIYSSMERKGGQDFAKVGGKSKIESFLGVGGREQQKK